jgi:SAM-dependent methyltransferase
VVVAWATELRARPELLRAWNEAFGGEDDVTLVILLPADPVVLAWLQDEAEALGMAGDATADILALPAAEPGVEAAALAGAEAVLSAAAADGLPALGAHADPVRIRAAFDGTPPAGAETAVRGDAPPAWARQLSPSLWHDLHRPPQPPRPSVAEYLTAAGTQAAQHAALRAALDGLPPSHQASGLRGEDVEALLALALRDTLPIPSPADREGYFDDDLLYWLFGLGDARLLEEVTAARGRPLGAGQRLLDMGCATGRVLRHLHLQHPELDLVGVEIGRHHVEWVRRHLPAAIWVAQTTVLPSLPLADASVDVLYAGSVFTHIGDFEEAWLLELHRVLRPEGLALLTFHPERTWAEMSAPSHVVTQTVTGPRHRAEPMGVEPLTADVFGGEMPAPRVVMYQPDVAAYNTITVHSAAWIEARWGRWFEVERVIERAHGDHQDAAVLRPR